VSADRNRNKRRRRQQRAQRDEHGRAAVTGPQMIAALLNGAPGRPQLEQQIGQRLEPPARCTPAQEEQLRALWATLPDIDCIGKCWDSCGPIRMSSPERALVQRAGADVPDAVHDGNAYLCPALTLLKRCAVYEVRPVICRLWGISDNMRCNYGCRPNGRTWLSDRECWAVIAETFRIAGDAAAADSILANWSTPELAAETDRRLRESREAGEFKREVQVARAHARGGVLYVQGPGQLGQRPARGTLQ